MVTRRLRSTLVTLMGTALLSVSLAACTGSSGNAASSRLPTSSSTPETGLPGATADGLQSAYESTIRSVLPSVVLIRTSHDLGSGVIFDNKGDIVTNAHVVGTATTFQVTLTGSAQSMPASLVGTYPVDDLAVISIKGAKNLRPIRFADSSNAGVGEIVLAVGNPLGLAGSVTNGIISAVGRTVSEPTGGGSPGATLPDTIQTSAAINPGNSGGALVDLSGNLVGIPTLAATDQQLGGGAAPGIGFAISSNIVKDVAGQLVAHGKVVVSHRAALGITATTVVDANGQPVGAGIASVLPASAAKKAGLQAGDVITQVSGTATPDAQALSAVLANLEPGQVVKVKVTRAGGSSKSLEVTLGALPG